MTYYPVISSQQTMPLPMGGEAATLTKQHNIINNMMITLPHAEQIDSKTLNLHQANLQKQKDFNTFNAFSTVHRSQKGADVLKSFCFWRLAWSPRIYWRASL